MKELPYFLLMLKKNVILWSIITANSFSSVDLKNVTHHFWTKQCLELKDYSVSNDDKFVSIKITITDYFTTIDFYTSSDKYLNDTKFYFDKEVSIKDKENQYVVDSIKVNSRQKDLGNFDIGLERPISIEVATSSLYGNIVSVTTYKKNWWKDMLKN